MRYQHHLYRRHTDVRRRLAQHRICLERDTAAGIIPRPAFAAIDGCYDDLMRLLETARVELEAVGPALEPEFVGLFVGGCARLDRQMFAAMYRSGPAAELSALAARLRREARTLREHLWLRLGRVAA